MGIPCLVVDDVPYIVEGPEHAEKLIQELHLVEEARIRERLYRSNQFLSGKVAMKHEKGDFVRQPHVSACGQVKEVLSGHNIRYGYVEITAGMAQLKKYLKIRDHAASHAEARASGSVGIPDVGRGRRELRHRIAGSGRKS